MSIPDPEQYNLLDQPRLRIHAGAFRASSSARRPDFRRGGYDRTIKLWEAALNAAFESDAAPACKWDRARHHVRLYGKIDAGMCRRLIRQCQPRSRRGHL